MKAAIAYQIGGKTILHASCMTTEGVWILCPPLLAVSSESFSDVGDAVIQALDGSREHVPHPTSWEEIFSPLFKIAGVRSWRAFASSAKCVEIETSGNRVSFVPTINLGAKGGFLSIRARIIDSPPVYEDLGMALLTAFQSCE